MKLRDYQSKSISMLYKWMTENKGHPCVVLPTGAGKSVVIAELIKNALQEWPETRVLMLCHQKELIEQNAQKMRAVWPGAPLGIYSASVGKKQLGEPITFAGIQSIRTKAKEVGHTDICIADECHCISHKDQGGYRNFLNELLEINPAMRIIGYSATPYRLGHGLITDAPAIFSDLIEPISIEELIYQGFLSVLRSKVTRSKLDTSGVKKRGGEYIESQLQAAVNITDTNERVVREVIELAGDRKAWLFFCAGINHAEAIAQELGRQGIEAACITGETAKGERERLLDAFKSGQIRALTNANVLTTGFDYPDIDLIAMLRPTLSPGLYVQMVGRGLRKKSHTDHCLVLDFAGVVETHGPITCVQPPKKAGDGGGEAPVKVCDNCAELCGLSARTCPACGHEFPPPPEKKLELRTDDIMGLEGTEVAITDWRWRVHISRSTGKSMLAVTYYAGLTDKGVTEYIPILHAGEPGDIAMRQLFSIAERSGADIAGLIMIQLVGDEALDAVVVAMNKSKPPSMIKYRRDGNFCRMMRREWSD